MSCNKGWKTSLLTLRVIQRHQTVTTAVENTGFLSLLHLVNMVNMSSFFSGNRCFWQSQNVGPGFAHLKTAASNANSVTVHWAEHTATQQA